MSSALDGFSGFAWKLQPAVALKPVSNSKGPYIAFSLPFKGMDDKPSLFSSRYLGRNGKVQEYNIIIINVFIHHKIKTTYLMLLYIIKILIKYSIRSHVKIGWDNIL